MQHLLHNDWTITNAALNYYADHKRSWFWQSKNLIFDDFSGRFSRAREKRADILALLSRHPKDHCTFTKWASQMIMLRPENVPHDHQHKNLILEMVRLHSESQKGHKPKTKDSKITDTHPSDAEQLAYLGKIHLEMLQAVNKKT